MVHVITNIKRPPKDLIDKFRTIGVATVYEASGRNGAADCAIKPITKGVCICGPAFTVQCHPGDNLMLHKALEIACPGDVLLASVGGHYEAGYWGELMATSAVAKKLGGLAIDGCIRDSEEIIKMGFPIFCRGFSIQGTTKSVIGLINNAIIFGSVLIHPGDLVIGDDDGIVIVDRGKCHVVLEKANKRIEAEKKKSALLKKGISSVKLNNLDKVFESLGLIKD